MTRSRDAVVREVRTHRVRGGISDWLLVALTTDAGVVGVGDATLEGQTAAVEATIRDSCETHLVGRSVFEISRFVDSVLGATFWRGGPVLMSAVGGLEIAMWDAVGKLLEQPIHRLLGGACRSSIPAYANGWYRSVDRPEQFADEARGVVADGYAALKLDPLGRTWGASEFSKAGLRNAVHIVAAIRETVGDDVDILLDLHGRLSPSAANAFLRAVKPLRPYWVEEAVPPEHFGRLRDVFRRFARPCGRRRAPLHPVGLRRVPQARPRRRGPARPRPRRGHPRRDSDGGGHGGVRRGGRPAHREQSRDHGRLAPPRRLRPKRLIQETFEDYDHPTMRSELFGGLPRLTGGELPLPDRPGLGIDLNEEACRKYPPRRAKERRGQGVLLTEDWPRACWEEGAS